MKKNALYFLQRDGEYFLNKTKNRRNINKTLKAFLLVSQEPQFKAIEYLAKTKEAHVTQIMIDLRVYDQSYVSQILARLRSINVVSCSQRGKFVYYTLNKERLQRVTETASKLAQFWS